MGGGSGRDSGRGIRLVPPTPSSDLSPKGSQAAAWQGPGAERAFSLGARDGHWEPESGEVSFAF